MKRLFAGPLPPDAPRCPARPVRPALLGVEEITTPAVILSAYEVTLPDGRVVAWPGTERDAIHYAGWYVVAGDGTTIASVEPKGDDYSTALAERP